MLEAELDEGLELAVHMHDPVVACGVDQGGTTYSVINIKKLFGLTSLLHLINGTPCVSKYRTFV